jgi:hypothetical protein
MIRLAMIVPGNPAMCLPTQIIANGSLLVLIGVHHHLQRSRKYGMDKSRLLVNPPNHVRRHLRHARCLPVLLNPPHVNSPPVLHHLGSLRSGMVKFKPPSIVLGI